MSTTINAALLQNQFNDEDISPTNAEIVIDGGINMLNVFLNDSDAISNLSGDAGSKTGSYSSKQAGAIMAIAQQIYSKHYTNADNTSSISLGPLGRSYTGDTELLIFAEKLAARLKGSSIAFVVGTDSSGLE